MLRFRSAGACACILATVLLMISAPAAKASSGSQILKQGATGKKVKALQVRIAGWYPKRDVFAVDGAFGPQTLRALTSFQRFYGLKAHGKLGRATKRKLAALEDADGSTAHFSFSEFKQNRDASCSKKANRYTGTFRGGPIPARKVKRNVRRLMWRLEALRAKLGGHAIGINSGFRSIAYNRCIGGARASQHLYGTAADLRVAGTSNRKGRDIAKRSQFHGIGCYSDLTHNHFDLRVDNPNLSEQQAVWWPDKNKRGYDLDYADRVCWGERSGGAGALGSSAEAIRAILGAVPGAGSTAPSPEEIEAFQAAGEIGSLGGRD